MMLRVENLEWLYSKIYTVETGFAAEVSIYPSLGMSLLLNYNNSKGIESHLLSVLLRAPGYSEQNTLQQIYIFLLVASITTM